MHGFAGNVEEDPPQKLKKTPIKIGFIILKVKAGKPTAISITSMQYAALAYPS